MSSSPGAGRIWAYAFGYFACYVPYSALTKLVSQGVFPGLARPVDGFELLPVVSAASALAMVAFVTWRGWWHHAGHRTFLGWRLPFPGPWTFLSGLATAAIIATTTLAYTLEGASIVFMMLLMRGGVLVLAPIVDVLGRRRVRQASWVALGLSLLALGAALTPGSGYALTPLAALDVAIYLAGYFVRLRFMSHLAKSDDRALSLRYFVEETMVASPVLLAVVAGVALFGHGPLAETLRAGFTRTAAIGSLIPATLVGALSQCTGVFGALILLDGRENAFCVPVNRASSVLAGCLTSAGLAWAGLAHGLPAGELVGAALLVLAMAVLAGRSAGGQVGAASTATGRSTGEAPR